MRFGLSFLFDQKFMCVGDVVIVKKDLTGRAQWKIYSKGWRSFIRGADGRVRAATVNDELYNI